MRVTLTVLLAFLAGALGFDAVAASAEEAFPVTVGTFKQEVAVMYGTAEGLPSAKTQAVAISPDGTVFAGTDRGVARLSGGRWTAVVAMPHEPVRCLAAGRKCIYAATDSALHRIDDASIETVVAKLPAAPTTLAVGANAIWLGTKQGLFRIQDERVNLEKGLNELSAGMAEIRQIAVCSDRRIAVAADSGLFLLQTNEWNRILPQEESASWAVRDTRGVAFDRSGRLWFASPQGVGCYDGAWQLFTGHDGLPYNDFTCVAPGADGVVWFGTKLGAARYNGKQWSYREGRRWLPGNEVRGIAVAPEGHAWFATGNGIGCIESRSMTLAEKARFYEDEIDKYHRRTPYEYVQWVRLEKPGDKSVWHQRDDDNDGQWTGEYGAAECFRYAATKDSEAKKRATKAFEALRFLSQVTQGGSHPVPRGFPARTILPTDGPNPNTQKAYSIEADREERATSDGLWKIMHPRWPTSKDGKWYWKCDTSSDELDGHYFLYALYYDLVAETPEEKEQVRQVVRDMTDHLIEHDYRLVDHDGKPTRWANYSPGSLNHDPNWWEERGLKSLSILAYLRIAEHVTGDAKYGALVDELIRDHAYAANVMYPKHQRGPGSYVQFDDEMAFMNFYSLLMYEKDLKLRELFALSCYEYWELEECERNPFYNFAFAVLCEGQTVTSPWGKRDLSPKRKCIVDAVDTLKRYPLDLVSWKLTNTHRIDVVPLSPLAREEGDAEGKGSRVSGAVLPVDERFINYWSDDPWQLDSGNDGKQLATGMPYLLAYYMGLYHGFIVEE